MSRLTVNDRIAAIEGAPTVLSGELQRFLDIAWSHRKNILETGSGSNSKIYKLYARMESKQGSTKVATVLPFLQQLQDRVVNLPGASPHWIQGQDDDTAICHAIYWIEESIQHGEQETDEEFGNLLWNFGFTFFHFPREGGVSNARIYLNVRPAYRVEVAVFVLGLIAKYPQDANKAKVAGPSNLRADGIVIWTKSLDQTANLLREIAFYQKGQRSYFEDGVPVLVHPVTTAGGMPLVGAGIASEPPDLNGVPQSYGKSRILPIYEALAAVRNVNPHVATTTGVTAQTLKQNFIAQVAARLRQEGIDPSSVHV